jgi:LacI family transcriptional regulator
MSQRITIADVAREAGVSAQTVSRVINNKGEIRPTTRQQVLDVIERMGYKPSSIARGLATNRTYTLGLSVPDIANPFWPEVARGIEDVAWDHGYNLFLCNTTESPQREAAILELLEEKRVDGVIVAGSRLADEQFLPLIARHQAAVLVNRAAPAGCQAGSVLIDAVGGATRGAAHLLAGGRRTVAFLAGPQHSSNGQRHLQGYSAALRAAGLEPDPALVAACPPTIEGGAQAARELLARRPDVDALYCYNDLIAIGALEGCAAQGRRVPDDIAVVGYDDILLARMVRPALTTLRSRQYEVGRAAAEMLLALVEGRAEPDEVVLPTELIVRESAP